MFRMVMLGAPGSGKGTISSRIVRDFKLKHLSVGDILRDNVVKKTAVGTEVEKYMKSGQLVPDPLMVRIMAAELVKLEVTPWLLDGFPRTLTQAKTLSANIQLDLVLSLEVPDSVIIDRIKDRWVHVPSGRIYNTLFNPPKVAGKDDITGEPLIQREDDLPEAVSRRLQVYADNTNPLKDYYSQQKLMKEFHGTESNEIYPRVKLFLEKVIPLCKS